MAKDCATDRQQMLHSALAHLQSALELMDRASVPAHVGAQVDLALHQLGTFLSATSAEPQLMKNEGATRH